MPPSPGPGAATTCSRGGAGTTQSAPGRHRSLCPDTRSPEWASPGAHSGRNDAGSAAHPAGDARPAPPAVPLLRPAGVLSVVDVAPTYAPTLDKNGRETTGHNAAVHVQV